MNVRPPLPIRYTLAFLHDVVVSALAWMVAFWLRFNLDIPSEFLRTALFTLPWVVLVNALLFWRLGLYRGLWRYASLPDLQKIVSAVFFAGMAAPVLFLFAAPVPPVPR